MKERIVILTNGTREEACRKFDACKSTIVDFNKEKVSIFGDIRKPKEGWTVIKTTQL